MPPESTHPVPECPSCFSCEALLRQTESWVMPDVWWFECPRRPGIENLRQWPFRTTTCDKYRRRKPIAEGEKEKSK
jgi:hypothetical protein